MTISHDLAYDLLTEFFESSEFTAAQSGSVIEPSRMSAAQAIGDRVRVGADDSPPTQQLPEVLATRRSTRFFDGKSLTAPVLTRLLRDALAQNNHADEPALEAYVVAQRVDGLPPAIYRFESEGHYLPVMELPAGSERTGLTLQPEFCEAPVIVSLAIPLDAAISADGSHGYRRAMVRTSAAAYAMWLDAVSRDLVGSVFAGFIPAAVRRPLHSDGTSRIQAFALALGHPAPQLSSESPASDQENTKEGVMP